MKGCVCVMILSLLECIIRKLSHQNTNPIFLMIQIALALVVPKSPLPERLALNPLCNPASRPS